MKTLVALFIACATLPLSAAGQRTVSEECVKRWPNDPSNQQLCEETKSRGSGTASAGSVGEPRLVIRVVKFDFHGSDARVTLPSGRVIVLSATDVDVERSRELLNARGGQSATSAAPSTKEPTEAEAIARMREKCAKDWPDDFTMRAFCQKQQQEALTQIQLRSMVTTDQRTIRRKCAADWPDDWHMRNFCEEQQLKALSQIR